MGASLNPVGLTARTIAVPHGVNPFNGDYNRDDVRAVEIPSANGIGTARSVARMYGSAACGGAEVPLSPGTLDALTAPAMAAEPRRAGQGDAHRCGIFTRFL